MHKSRKLLLVIAGSVVMLGMADAGSSTATINITATVPANCTLSADTANVTLGDFSHVAVNSSFNLNLTCNKGAVVGLTVQSTNGFGLINGSTSIPYRLDMTGPPGSGTYSSAAGGTSAQTIFSNLVAPGGGTDTFTGKVSIADQSGKSLPSGSYSDVVTFTLSYS
mgnify:CR=1 FL=1